MALPSSGQISLNDIATEFGGTAPHALSEYYSKGNAPASGEIQLAQDFYGTSSGISFSATLTIGSSLIKSGNSITGFFLSNSDFSGASRDGGTYPTSMGSLSTQLSGNNIRAIFRNSHTTQADELHLEFSNANSTNWSTLTIGSTTLNKSNASIGGTNRIFTWQNAGNATNTYFLDSNGSFNYCSDPFDHTSGCSSSAPSGTVSVSIA